MADENWFSELEKKAIEREEEATGIVDPARAAKTNEDLAFLNKAFGSRFSNILFLSIGIVVVLLNFFPGSNAADLVSFFVPTWLYAGFLILFLLFFMVTSSIILFHNLVLKNNKIGGWVGLLILKWLVVIVSAFFASFPVEIIKSFNGCFAGKLGCTSVSCIAHITQCENLNFAFFAGFFLIISSSVNLFLGNLFRNAIANPKKIAE